MARRVHNTSHSSMLQIDQCINRINLSNIERLCWFSKCSVEIKLYFNYRKLIKNFDKNTIYFWIHYYYLHTIFICNIIQLINKWIHLFKCETYVKWELQIFPVSLNVKSNPKGIFLNKDPFQLWVHPEVRIILIKIKCVNIIHKKYTLSLYIYITFQSQ